MATAYVVTCGGVAILYGTPTRDVGSLEDKAKQKCADRRVGSHCLSLVLRICLLHSSLPYCVILPLAYPRLGVGVWGLALFRA